MRKFVVKEVNVGDYFEDNIQYGVYEEVQDTGIHTKGDKMCNLIVLCHSELIAEKIREELELDDFIYESENK